MFTILGGAWSGRRLKTLEKEGLRPSSARVKAGIFSLLEALEWKRCGQRPDYAGWRCLDLYAGVGGLGLEILSRGAAHCVFVEKQRAHAKVLAENIRALSCEPQTELLVEPVEKKSWVAHGPYHLILVDPPYKDSHLTELLQQIVADRVLAPGGIVLFEHDPKVSYTPMEGLEIHSQRTLGPAGITVFLRK